MADRLLLAGTTDGFLLADASGVLLVSSPYAVAILQDDPDAYYRLGEPSGTNAVDIANGHDGTYAGSLTLAQTGLVAGDTAVAFTNGTVTAPGLTNVSAGAFCVELWVQRANTTHADYGLFNRSGTNRWIGFWGSDGALHFIGGAGSINGVNSTTSTYDTGVHHIVFRHDGTTSGWFTYLDGVDVSGTPTTGASATNSANVVFGVDLAADPWVGTLDEAAYYAHDLSPSQIAAHYAAGIPAITVTPGTASLTLTAFTPTVSTTAHQLVIPGVASLTVTRFAPVLRLSVIPPTAALTLSSFAPTVTASNNQLVVPGVASLALATFAPTVTAGASQTVVPGTATLALSSFAPQLRLGVIPPVAALTLATFAPQVRLAVIPPAASLTLATFAPQIRIAVTPATASLITNRFAPTVTATANVVVTPGTASLSLSTFAPTVTGGQGLLVVPGVASLTVTRFAPTVSATAHQLVTPATRALSLTAFAPGVVATDHKRATPPTAALLLTAFAPTVSNGLVLLSVPGPRGRVELPAPSGRVTPIGAPSAEVVPIAPAAEVPSAAPKAAIPVIAPR